uniref:Uncharacterized protein n=1 Tax=Hyaloperonospora arabidopsidis (strain Emoy2) TaxID=559515 RepID=M4BXA9_HYAAE
MTEGSRHKVNSGLLVTPKTSMWHRSRGRFSRGQNTTTSACNHIAGLLRNRSIVCSLASQGFLGRQRTECGISDSCSRHTTASYQRSRLPGQRLKKELGHYFVQTTGQLD